MKEQEFAEKYSRHVVGLGNYVRGILGHTAFVDDIVADSFVLAWTKIHQYDPERGQFSTWLYRIAHNLAIKHKRNISNSHRGLENIDLVDAADEEMQTAEHTMEDVVALLNTLENPKHRRVLQMFILERKSYTQISQELGEPLGSVKNWMKRGRTKLGIERFDFQPARQLKTLKRSTLRPYLYQVGNRYNVYKKENGKPVFRGSFSTEKEAVEFQDFIQSEKKVRYIN